ncbi:hypothetical protein D3C84_968720 [compost metagenome]
MCTTQPFTVFRRAVKSGAASIQRPMTCPWMPSTYSDNCSTTWSATRSLSASQPSRGATGITGG